MADICCAPTDLVEHRANVYACPGCGKHGRQVALITVQAQVAVSLQELVASPYQLCASPGCAVVYYAAGAPPITRAQVREHVFPKEATPDVLICHCFRHSLGAIQQSDQVGRAAILANIVAGTRQGQCACELRNPQGRCCLGDVRRLMRGDELTIDWEGEGAQ
jgi:hypothetical protein